MSIATLDLLELSNEEEYLVNRLANRVIETSYLHDLQNAYYEGTMRIASLGVSIPPQLQGLKTVVGWPRVVVDSVQERLDIEGFRFSDATDADQDLWDIWQANDLDEESRLAHLDSLVYGSAYITVGSPDEDTDGMPLICVESPLDLACIWDARTRKITSAFRSFYPSQYYDDRLKQGTLYLPDQTVSVLQEGTGWAVVDRDIHNLGQVPVVRISNKARITDRTGRSEITPELISLTDAACRTLLGMEVAREFYAAPQRYILGATESAFQGPDGTAKTAWETYMGRVLALERDGDGNVPTIGQFAAGSPDAFTKVIDSYAKIVTSITGLPAEYLGITTSNPSSADAIRMNTDRLITKVKHRQGAFEGGWEQAMRLALLIRDGNVPSDAKRMETIWKNPAIPTPAATAEALFRQVQGGMIPAASDVTLEHLGYSAQEIVRLNADRQKDLIQEFLATLAVSLGGKEAKVDKTLANTITTPVPTPGVAPTVPTNNPPPLLQAPPKNG